MTPSTLRFPFPVVAPPRPAPAPLRADASDWATFLVHPPSDAVEFRTAWPELETAHLKPGTVTGIRLRSGADWTHLEPAVRQLRTRLPAAPVVLLCSGAWDGTLRLSARAARAGVRAVLREEEPLRDGLRVALTCRDTLADDVVDWLSLRRLRLSPMVSTLLREIFAQAPAHPDLSTLLSQVGMAESSARFRLHKRLLPTPSRWFQAARALHAVLRLQAEPRTCLLRIANEFGYADHSALSQLVYRAFRVRPGAIRGTLGWEWLMHRWVSSLPDGSRTLQGP
jgi:AraC-like DNA-binding protein